MEDKTRKEQEDKEEELERQQAEKPPKATPEEIAAEKELEIEPPLRVEPRARGNPLPFNLGGGLAKNIITSVVVVVLLVFMALPAFGGGSFVTKKDFETNIIGMNEIVNKAVADVVSKQGEINTTLQNIPASINSAMAQSTAQLTQQISGISSKVDGFNSAIQNNTNKVDTATNNINALSQQVTELTDIVNLQIDSIESLNDLVVDLQKDVKDYDDRLDDYENRIEDLEDDDRRSSSNDIEDDLDIDVRMTNEGAADQYTPPTVQTRARIEIEFDNDTGYDLEDIEILIYAEIENCSDDYKPKILYQSGQGSWVISEWSTGSNDYAQITIRGRQIDVDDNDRENIVIWVDSQAADLDDGQSSLDINDVELEDYIIVD